MILRHLRIRVGEIKGPGNLRRSLGEQTHALDLTGMNIIADHCDVAYANDQIFNTYGTNAREAVTLQWSYVYGAPRRSRHEKGDHSMTTVGVGWGFVSLHHNLFAHSLRRNPRVDMLTYDFRNNVIYNFLGNGYGSDNDTRRLNYVGNVMKKGPDSTAKVGYAFSGKGHYWQAYSAGNQLPPEFKGVFEAAGVEIPHPHPFAPVVTHSAAEAYRLVLDQGGATKPDRDRITRHDRYTPARAPADKTANGIPDEWEHAHGLDPATAKATGRDLDPRYDNIEIYLNSLCQ